MSPELFGVTLDPLTRAQTLRRVEEAITERRHLSIATINTEWLMRAKEEPVFRDLIARASLRVADGSGVLWAARFLELPWRGSLWSTWQMIYSGASLVLYPPFCRSPLPETVVGSQLVTELAHLGDQRGWRIFLLGGAPGVAASLEQTWRTQYPGLTIASSGADPDQAEGARDAKAFKPDLILVAYRAQDQLDWLNRYLGTLPPTVGIGVGGSFDYLVGSSALEAGAAGRVFRARPAPRRINALGLEWLWRLVTQPWRWRRIIVAVPLFIGAVLQYRKHQMSNADRTK